MSRCFFLQHKEICLLASVDRFYHTQRGIENNKHIFILTRELYIKSKVELVDIIFQFPDVAVSQTVRR